MFRSRRIQQLFGLGLFTLFMGLTASMAHAAVTESKVWPSGAASYDFFGRSLDVHGNTMAIGAVESNNVNRNDPGSVYMFERDTTWTQVQQLTADDGANGDYFGQSVALDGNYALVGAFRDDVQVVDDGSAYLFQKQSGTWTQVHKFYAADGETFDYFGSAVSLDENFIYISAYLAGADQNATVFPGAVYVFDLKDSNFSLVQKISPTDGATGDHFGYALSVDGNYLAVGARNHKPGSLTTGAVYSYKWNGSSFTLLQKIVPNGLANGDKFGHSLVVSGTFLLVGAPERDTAASNAGAMFMLRRSADTYTLQDTYYGAGLTTNDNYGVSVDMANGYFAVGASNFDNFAGSGAVFLYQMFNPTIIDDTFPVLKTNVGPAGDLGSVVRIGDGWLVAASSTSNNVGPWSGVVYEFNDLPETTFPANTTAGAIIMMLLAGAAMVYFRRNGGLAHANHHSR